MRPGGSTFGAIILALASCSQKAAHEPVSNAAQPANTVLAEPAASIPPPATGPDAKTPFGEPGNAIDPKSLEAAGQVVRRFGALVEQNRFEEAARLWGDRGSAVRFMEQLPPSTHLQIGKPGRAEGAAGSIYTAVPAFFTGETIRRPADVVLRRINDVPGSSEAERRWRIERIDWKVPG